MLNTAQRASPHYMLLNVVQIFVWTSLSHSYWAFPVWFTWLHSHYPNMLGMCALPTPEQISQALSVCCIAVTVNVKMIFKWFHEDLVVWLWWNVLKFLWWRSDWSMVVFLRFCLGKIVFTIVFMLPYYLLGAVYTIIKWCLMHFYASRFYAWTVWPQ